MQKDYVLHYLPFLLCVFHSPLIAFSVPATLCSSNTCFSVAEGEKTQKESLFCFMIVHSIFSPEITMFSIISESKH